MLLIHFIAKAVCRERGIAGAEYNSVFMLRKVGVFDEVIVNMIMNTYNLNAASVKEYMM